MFREEVENREVLARAGQHFIIDHLVREQLTWAAALAHTILKHASQGAEKMVLTAEPPYTQLTCRQHRFGVVEVGYIPWNPTQLTLNLCACF